LFLHFHPFLEFEISQLNFWKPFTRSCFSVPIFPYSRFSFGFIEINHLYFQILPSFLSRQSRYLLGLLGGLSAAVGTGCSMLANPRTAEIRPVGQSEWGLSVGSSNAASLSRTSRNPSKFLSQSAPVILPEICFAQALSPDWEMGGRASLTALGVEGYAKWGMLQGRKWRLALAPLLGHGNMDPGTMAYAEIPWLATYRTSSRIAYHGSLFAGLAKAVGDIWGDVPLPLIDRTVGSAHYWGMGMGFEVGRERWIIRPLWEVSILAPRGAADWSAYWRTDFTVNFSWVFPSKDE
jgi:hypothetical protein